METEEPETAVDFKSNGTDIRDKLLPILTQNIRSVRQ
jgi:hypothetical protein